MDTMDRVSRESLPDASRNGSAAFELVLAFFEIEAAPVGAAGPVTLSGPVVEGAGKAMPCPFSRA